MSGTPGKQSEEVQVTTMAMVLHALNRAERRQSTYQLTRPKASEDLRLRTAKSSRNRIGPNRVSSGAPAEPQEVAIVQSLTAAASTSSTLARFLLIIGFDILVVDRGAF